MSEAYSDESEFEAAHDAELEDGEGVGLAEDGDEDDDAAPKPRDWEKLAHSREGQAARERSKRKAAEGRARELEARIEKLEGGSKAPSEDELLKLIASLREDEDDPVGDIAAVKKALRLYRERNLTEAQQTEQQRTIQRQVEGLRTGMAEAEADFAGEHPDYHDAAKFYRESRHEELKDAGYSGAALDRKLADDLFGMVRMALDAGLDPAERVYGLAKRRGFKAGKGPAEAKLDRLERAGASGVRTQGRDAPTGNLTWADVAKLDGPARDKAWAKLREREMRRRVA